MRAKIILLFFIGSFLGFAAKAQPVKKTYAENYDCSTPIEIKDSIYSTTYAPLGHGCVQEFNGNKTDLYSFEEEHNSGWYFFKIKNTGKLELQIIPQSINDDYDFLLFKYSGKDFCNDVATRKIVPVRTCISRNDKSIKSITGMSDTARDSFIHSGPGSSFCKSLDVKKGELYYLVVDNVYPNGQGHTIKLHYKNRVAEIPKTTEIKTTGIPTKPAKDIWVKVVDKESRLPKKANIKLFRISNNIKTFKCSFDSVDECSLKLPADSIYVLEVQADGCFDHSQKIVTTMPTPNYVYQVELNKIAEGSHLIFENILFQGGSARLVTEAQPVLESIAATLLRNTNIDIEIHGHVNCPRSMDCEKKVTENYNLSVARAKAVYDYLVVSGVSAERLSYKGFGASQMLFPDATTDDQMKFNRRVEIIIAAIH
jgi:flagellar motor protein MotB